MYVRRVGLAKIMMKLSFVVFIINSVMSIVSVHLWNWRW